MKTFLLKGNGDNPAIDFTLTDPVPIRQTIAYGYRKLCKLVNYRDYFADILFDKADYEAFYRIPANKGSDFFRIKDTAIIVIPGNALFPTLLGEYQIL